MGTCDSSRLLGLETSLETPRPWRLPRPLVIVRVAELRTDQTWRTIGDQLQPIKLGRFRSPDGEFSQRTELTTDQQRLLHTLGVPEPPRFADIAPHPPPTPP